MPYLRPPMGQCGEVPHLHFRNVSSSDPPSHRLLKKETTCMTSFWSFTSTTERSRRRTLEGLSSSRPEGRCYRFDPGGVCVCVCVALTLCVRWHHQSGQQQEMQRPKPELHGLAALRGCGAVTDSLRAHTIAERCLQKHNKARLAWRFQRSPDIPTFHLNVRFQAQTTSHLNSPKGLSPAVVIRMFAPLTK